MTINISLVGFALVLLNGGILAEEVILSINIKKPLTVTSEKFLSITLDPTFVLTGDLISNNYERSINMAKALSPAFVRIAGPRSNSYTFAKGQVMQEEDPGFIFTEANWNTLNRWAENSGLDVVAAVAPQQHSDASGTATRDTIWDSRNVLDLISFSDHMGFNITWQLGYECQTRCDISGGDLGRDVMRLRNILQAFPRYTKSMIVGPDVVTFKTKLQQIYLQEYLNSGITGLSAITWHPNFASITVDQMGVSMHHDNLAIEKDALYRIIGRQVTKKPLWLAESRPEECKKQFLGALVWLRRLGNSAKLGAQVLMRQPQNSDLFAPTPDYWVSVLHKRLIGREVFDTKIATGNRTHIHFYCQCTKPSSIYEKGSLTVFGINLTPAKLAVSLKGLKIKTLHKYILLPGFDAENRMFSETVLLNNEPLKLVNGKDIPEMNPAVANSGKGLSMKLPSGGIGFWVIPDAKIKACEGPESEGIDKMFLKKLTKRIEEVDSDENIENEDSDLQDIDNSEEHHSFSKSLRKRRRKNRNSSEDDEIMHRKKLDARRDFERLEKLLKWRGNHDGKRIQTLRGKVAHIDFDDKSYEWSNSDESVNEIREKLEFYKKRLTEYEVRRRNSMKIDDKQENSDDDTLDREKIQEAMNLITKLENTIKSFDNSTNLLDTEDDITTKLSEMNTEEQFLDDLLKTRKIKRTSVPEKIEQQLRAIYEMLAEEKKRRQKLNEDKIINEVEEKVLPRNKRDVDKKFGVDPLGLRKDTFYSRRRNKNDDIKEKRFGKLRKKDDKKDTSSIIFDPKNPLGDSDENNFYGFVKRDPIKGFPEGDVYVMTGTSSEETINDYDYVRDDDDYIPGQGRRKKSKNTEKYVNHQDFEDTWVEDADAEISEMPKEFLENVHLNSGRIDKKLENYGELWEAEALGDAPEVHFDGVDSEKDGILQAKPRNEGVDRRTKETVVRQLMGYYENPGVQQSDEDLHFSDASRVEVHSLPLNSRGIAEDVMKRHLKELESGGKKGDLEAMSFRRPVASSAELDSIPRFANGENQARGNSRPRRNAEDLDTILDKEMIFQDDNNLKDCQCRVIRDVKINDKLQERLAGILERVETRESARKEKTEARKSARKERTEARKERTEMRRTQSRTRTRRDVAPEVEYEYSYEDVSEDEQPVDSKQEVVRQDRDIVAQLTTTPAQLTTVSTTAPTTEKNKLFRSKNSNKAAQASIKSSKSIDAVSSIPEGISPKNPDNKENHAFPEKPAASTVEKIPTSITEKSKKVEVKGEPTSVKITEARAITTIPEENQRMTESTTELLQSRTSTTESTRKTRPTKATSRAIKNTTPRIKTSAKTQDSAKVREARLIVKSEALLAAKRENDSKLARKITNSSSKALAETAERQKKRREQMEKLRKKLKTQRDKRQKSMASDSTGKSKEKLKAVKKREVQFLNDQGEIKTIVDKAKWDYVMLYKPINYATITEVDDTEDEAESNYIPEYIEVVRPLHEPWQKKTGSLRTSNYQHASPIMLNTDESLKNNKNLEDNNDKFLNNEDYAIVDVINVNHENTEGENLRMERQSGLKNDEVVDKILKNERMPNFMGIEENSNEKISSSEIEDAAFEIIKEEDHYLGVPLDENEKKSKTKKYAEGNKYKTPKYARLVGKKSIEQEESTNNDDLAVDEYELMMVIPLANTKQKRERRDLSNDIKIIDAENDIWRNDIPQDIYSINEISQIHSKANSQSTIRENPLTSLVEEAIPKIGDVVSDGLSKAQNVTGSIEKLLNEFDETNREIEYDDEKKAVEMAIKNNPDGLLTHDFFHDTIQNVKKFFNFLNGFAHVLLIN